MSILRSAGALLLCALLGSAVAQAAPDTLSARLVTASREGGDTDARLTDVLPLLQNLGLKSFRLDGESTLPFREGASASLGKGYRLELSQVQGSNAMVRVTQNQRDLVKTRLSLREDKPVTWVFDDPGGGKTIIVLKLN